MLTQKIIKGWLPGLNAVFRYHLPLRPIPYPMVQFSNARNYLTVRGKIIETTGCKIKMIPEDSCMEFIHGSLNDVILIRTDQLPAGTDFDFFGHLYWHEMGHFYANNANAALEKYNDPDNPPLEEPEENVKYKQRGYWFWDEFIAEALANYVDYKFRSSNPENPSEPNPSYQPEKIDWKVETWENLVDWLMDLLEQTFWTYEDIDEYILAHYFATLLMDDKYKEYVNAAREGKLKIYGKDTPEAPGTIEPTCISDQDEEFQPILWEMKAMLERQLKKREFWKTDEAMLEKLGRLIYGLDELKAEMIRREEDY